MTPRPAPSRRPAPSASSSRWTPPRWPWWSATTRSPRTRGAARRCGAPSSAASRWSGPKQQASGTTSPQNLLVPLTNGWIRPKCQCPMRRKTPIARPGASPLQALPQRPWFRSSTAVPLCARRWLRWPSGAVRGTATARTAGRRWPQQATAAAAMRRRASPPRSVQRRGAPGERGRSPVQGAEERRRSRRRNDPRPCPRAPTSLPAAAGRRQTRVALGATRRPTPPPLPPQEDCARAGRSRRSARPSPVRSPRPPYAMRGPWWARRCGWR